MTMGIKIKETKKGEVMINEKYIRFDWAVKRMLRDKANFDVLEGLITVLLGEKITIEELLESEGNQEALDDKFNRVDIKAKDSWGCIIVTIQIAYDITAIENLRYGTAKTITAHISNYNYQEGDRIYTIILQYYNMSDGSWHVHQGCRNSINYSILMIPNFNDVATTPIEEWLDYLKNGRIKEDTKTPGLAEARKKLQYMQMSRAEQIAYERHMDSLAVQSGAFDAARLERHAEGWEVGREEGFAEGRAEGRAEGEKDKALEIARKMKAKGFPIEDISAITGLDLSEITNL